MATTITAGPHQTFLDLAIQATGSIESMMQFCKDNNVSITGNPVPGQTYVVSDKALLLGDTKTLQYLTENDVTLGTRGVDPV